MFGSVMFFLFNSQCSSAISVAALSHEAFCGTFASASWECAQPKASKLPCLSCLCPALLTKAELFDEKASRADCFPLIEASTGRPLPSPCAFISYADSRQDATSRNISLCHVHGTDMGPAYIKHRSIKMARVICIYIYIQCQSQSIRESTSTNTLPHSNLNYSTSLKEHKLRKGEELPGKELKESKGEQSNLRKSW